MLAWILLGAFLLPVAVGGISCWVAGAVSSRLNYFRGTVAFLIAFLPLPGVSWWLCAKIIKYVGNLPAGVPMENTGGDGPRHRRREAIKAVDDGTDGPVYGS